MKNLPKIVIGRNLSRNTQNAVSPFRYPGGKGFLSDYLSKHVKKLERKGGIHFVEPFCGGAGAALNLLADGYVDRLHLNDADIRIHSAWRAMLFESELFIEKITSTQLTMDEWYHHQELVANPRSSEYSFDLGFSTFYMNRTSRSGIVTNAGPIGGYSQNGKWKIDARFNRDRLANQVEWIAGNCDSIALYNSDALGFLDRLRRHLDAASTLFFIDPPYVKAGGRLYFNSMTEAKHIALADLLTSGTIPHWVLTYDDAPLIREIYRGSKMSKISVNYSLQNKRKDSEILILPY